LNKPDKGLMEMKRVSSHEHSESNSHRRTGIDESISTEMTKKMKFLEIDFDSTRTIGDCC